MKNEKEIEKEEVETPVTIQLRKPIQWGTQTKTMITELTLRPPNAGDIRSLPLEPDHGALLDLAARLSGKPSKLIDKLGIRDMKEVLKVVSDFI